jgi:hypothetical protein
MFQGNRVKGLHASKFTSVLDAPELLKRRSIHLQLGVLLLPPSRTQKSKSSNDMQSREGEPEEPPLVEICFDGHLFETYVANTDAIAEGWTLQQQ